MLKIHEDAYGQMIHDHLHGRETYEIVEREDGYIAVSAGASAYFATFESWRGHNQKAMDFVRGRVLDIGSGAGRCSLYLQERGHDVLATDNSPLAIRSCKERGVKHAKVIPITQLNRALRTFDTILMMGNNFGLFGNRERACWLLRRFKGMTSPRARILAESNDPYQTEEPAHLQYHQFNRRRGRMGGQVRIRVRYRKCRTPWFDYLLVSKPEMEGILEGTGWRVMEYLDSPGSVYIAVIERED